ncbi:Radical SAM domain protein [Desulfofarcimen acetoxidans DSM 771]|uniref:Radical SAM domain protein n=1 Tax=Desulfofarcimen acetoxidans (strain ATCC 49208 / DSM 771 / KCTC 5769 / VKM B-1644 / 5575) TaxID=485916 RepID=C8W424_DESAS|nr:AmmeMemoRadiSam system radical SAM enzyme [Desulfofarcimen acetoxidans]ACV61278.1 Radical SAM domain protein [Desulfofarcimen acetoxidans DSM 771]
MREAMYYEKKENNLAACRLCPKLCTIRENRTGFCRARKNIGGTLYSLNYGECSSHAIDPIEKKPLYHFYPGTNILSLGTFGCNLRCGFCQNWSIAHETPHTVGITPEQVLDIFRQQAADVNCIGLAYTYSEPLMWYEFVLDTAKLIHAAGFKNVLVTNGYIGEEPLREIIPYIDAMNIDIKGFTEEYYHKTCIGNLSPVLRTVEIAVSQNCHVELTTLLITGLNDSEEEISNLVNWIAGVNKNIPLHFSRYFPNYQMNLPATPLETLKIACSMAKEKLNYVYAGNAAELNVSNTVCPQCGEVIISRLGYRTRIEGLKDSRCMHCGEKIYIVQD